MTRDEGRGCAHPHVSMNEIDELLSHDETNLLRSDLGHGRH
jgi:hypothetical protein